MQMVVGVRFKKAGKVYYFNPDNIDIQNGDNVIVETSRGIEYGAVVVAPKILEKEELLSALKNVIRKATDEDRMKVEENKAKESRALATCTKKIAEYNLAMKLVSVEYAFDNSKAIFYFTADSRVDFRELVKDLAGIFKTRIELRQIGVRDEARMVGGLGPCGRQMCCVSFIGDFDPVSIKMAKEQCLSLNPAKISGVCGRLMCCLKFEQACYEEMRSRMPKLNKEVLTPKGKGTVVETNVLREKLKVKLIHDDGTCEIAEFPLASIRHVCTGPNGNHKESEEAKISNAKKTLPDE